MDDLDSILEFINKLEESVSAYQECVNESDMDFKYYLGGCSNTINSIKCAIMDLKIQKTKDEVKMSNHAAGHLISAVLRKLDGKGVFANLNEEEVAEIIIDVAQLVYRVDGNFPEAVAGINKKYNICYCCETYHPEGLNEDGLCRGCE